MLEMQRENNCLADSFIHLFTLQTLVMNTFTLKFAWIRDVALIF